MGRSAVLWDESDIGGGVIAAQRELNQTQSLWEVCCAVGVLPRPCEPLGRIRPQVLEIK
jgi:hypothetical protein